MKEVVHTVVPNADAKLEDVHHQEDLLDHPPEVHGVVQLQPHHDGVQNDHLHGLNGLILTPRRCHHAALESGVLRPGEVALHHVA